jgi:hypothetical protein
MPDTATYESWNCHLVDALPKRSCLYNLAPMGVGGAQVESLTGYIARLAEAHCVPASLLLSHELLPRTQQDDSVKLRPAARNSGFIYDAYVLNGVCECPRDLVLKLQALTGQSSLRALTMLLWSHVISEFQLLRSDRAWCPYCYDSWRNGNSPVYEPLLWTLSAVSVCTIHGHQLQRRCPHCRRGSQVLAARPRPGHCYRCQRWLGEPLPSRQSANGTYSESTGLSYAHQVGEMLAAAPRLLVNPVSGACFKHNLRRLIDEFADGNCSRLAGMTGVSLHSIYHWSSIERRIRLDFFLQMCCKLRLSAVRLLSEYIPASDPDWNESRWCARHNLYPEPRRPTHVSSEELPESVINGRLSKPPRTRDSVQAVFERALCEPKPQSVEAIARNLGYQSTTSLYKWFPDLCHAMAMKHFHWWQKEDERIREAIIQALEQTPPPSLKGLAVLLGHSASTLRDRVPVLIAALAARLPERRQFERERLQERLQSALESNPVPSLKDVAKSIGKHKTHLRVLFPTLCDRITNRHIEEIRKLSGLKRIQGLP